MGKKVEPGKLEAEAAKAGLVLLGPGKSAFYRTYRRIECGHEAQYVTTSIRKYESVRCKQCDEANLVEESTAAGLVLLGPGKDKNYRTYRRIECGHEAQYTLHSIRECGSVRCKQCDDKRFAEDAAKAGLVLLGPGKDRFYRNYRWQSCGHEAGYQLGAVRNGHVRCQVCDATAWSKPSNIYLLQFAADDGNTWLKLGVSSNIDYRISRYGLLDEVRLIERLATIPFETGKAATAVEKALHISLRKHRIHSGQMKDYMKSGHTECYPVTMRDEILEALSA
jgi:hypothetical protein